MKPQPKKLNMQGSFALKLGGKKIDKKKRKTLFEYSPFFKSTKILKHKKIYKITIEILKVKLERPTIKYFVI